MENEIRNKVSLREKNNELEEQNIYITAGINNALYRSVCLINLENTITNNTATSINIFLYF